MLRTLRAYINALTEKRLSKRIKLHRKWTNNPIPLSSESQEMQTIGKLTGELKVSNLKIYSKHMAKTTGKKAAFLAPIALAGLTMLSEANVDYVKTIQVDSIYEESVLEFDEESVLNEYSTTIAKTSFPKEYVDDSIVSIISSDNLDLSSNTIIYYGDGSKSLQVKFNINDDHTWEYASHTNNMHEKSNVERPDEIRVTDEECLSLIREATETFIRHSELSEEEINYVRELVNNNENDILVKIKRCSELGPLTLEVNSVHWFRSLMLLIATICVTVFLIKKFTDLTTCEKLTTIEARSVGEKATKISLVTGYGVTKTENLLKAAKNYRDTYLEAEKNRLSLIIKALEKNGGDEEIINQYNKRLSITLPPSTKKD